MATEGCPKSGEALSRVRILIDIFSWERGLVGSQGRVGLVMFFFIGIENRLTPFFFPRRNVDDGCMCFCVLSLNETKKKCLLSAWEGKFPFTPLFRIAKREHKEDLVAQPRLTFFLHTAAPFAFNICVERCQC